MSDAAYTIAESGSTLNYCALHWVWYAPRTHCMHCATAAQIRELRAIVLVLESRVADLEAQAMQDRRRIYPLEARLIELQQNHNVSAAAALAATG